MPSKLVVSFLLALFVTLAVVSVTQKGATFDETVKLPAAYTYWTTGDFRMNVGHPPLAKLLAGLPLLLTDVRFSADWPEWQQGRQYSFGSRFLFDENDAATLLFLGRLPMAAIGCLLGLLIWCWTHELAGRTAAHLALLLFVLTPDFLAHSPLVATDVPVTTFMFATAYALWRNLRRWTVVNTIVTGLTLGAVLTVKFSGVVIAPVLLLYGLVRLSSKTPWSYQRWLGREAETCDTVSGRLRLLGVTAACCAVLCLLVIWMAYGFRYAGPVRSDGTAVYDWKAVQTPGSLPASTIEAARTAHLIPEGYAYGFLNAHKTAQNRVAFLNGMRSSTGWWYYFAETFLLKTPIAEILAILIALGMLAFRASRKEAAWDDAALLIPVAVYVLVALTASLNIGHRHLLPIYPFLFVLAGSALAHLLAQQILIGLTVPLLVGWLAFESASIHPSYLAYFNQFAGGPENGWRFLVDSNVDWGQDLPGLKRWMDERGIRTIKLSYFGSDVPEYHGIGYEALPSFFALRREQAGEVRMTPGDLVAVSATNLQGVYFWGQRYREFNEFVSYLRDRLRPEATIGHSIYIFRISEARSLYIPRGTPPP